MTISTAGLHVFRVSFAFVVAFLCSSKVDGHGYLMSPRSRNFVAYQDGKDWPILEENPLKENCPHCLNLGGTLARCGLTSGRNYDFPKNAVGKAMPTNIQKVFTAGQEIIVDVVLTAHHRGHFTFKACAMDPSSQDAPTQECFDENPIMFMEDMLYGAPADKNYPDRAYIAPTNHPLRQNMNTGQSGMLFTYKLKLPENLTGDLILIQWHYMTANSCIHPGYDGYDWPDSSWQPSTWSLCGPIPPDGNGVPEQFWNCAEVKITPSGPTAPTVPPPAPTLPPPTVSPPTIPPPTMPPPTNSEPTVPPPTNPVSGTCGGGQVGNGICDGGLCCSEWGWCGSSTEHCKEAPPTTPPPPTMAPPPSPPISGEHDDSRLIAYVGNWEACPTAAQVAKYTHIVIAFAVSYQWSPSKNICSETCEIAEPPICNNSPNPTLVSEWQNAGKKVILSFGGAGMGGSWAGDNNDCWEYCFGRENQVVNRITEIVSNMGLDGVDIDYEYFYEDGQNGSNFNKGSQAQNFLRSITWGLRNNLASGAIVTHAPMEPDIVPGTKYYDLFVELAPALDFVMPQYYNGNTMPATDGFAGGVISAEAHYTEIVENIFDGDATKIVFGFCISGCIGNANKDQAAMVMLEVGSYYPCNGGAYFWVASQDTAGAWSQEVSSVVAPNAGCSGPSAPTTPPPPTLPPVTAAPVTPPPPTNPPPTPAPITSSPVTAAPITSAPVTPPPVTAAPITSAPVTPPPVTTPAPVTDAPVAAPTMPPPTSVAPVAAPTPLAKCCPDNYTGLRAYDSCTKYYHCVGGVVTGSPLPCAVGTLFDNNIQSCNWENQVTCTPDSCGPSPSPPPPPPPEEEEICCPSGFTGLRAHDSCTKYYHCVGGVVTGSPLPCAGGTLFDNNIQNCNWENQVQCAHTPCTSRRMLRTQD